VYEEPYPFPEVVPYQEESHSGLGKIQIPEDAHRATLLVVSVIVQIGIAEKGTLKGEVD